MFHCSLFKVPPPPEPMRWHEGAILQQWFSFVPGTSTVLINFAPLGEEPEFPPDARRPLVPFGKYRVAPNGSLKFVEN